MTKRELREGTRHIATFFGLIIAIIGSGILWGFGGSLFTGGIALFSACVLEALIDDLRS